MTKLNLLPWRDERRRERKRQFQRLLGLAGTLGLVIVLGVFAVNGGRIALQEGRNQTLTSENAALDISIREIRELKQQIEALHARRASVEHLQASRQVPVHLLDELVSRLPQGVMLKSVKQAERLSLTGYAQSNGRVSELLRSLEAGAEWLGQPELIEIKSASVGQGRDARRLFEFTIALGKSGMPEKKP
jgi:type IV pilus assembly protein PilN